MGTIFYFNLLVDDLLLWDFLGGIESIQVIIIIQTKLNTFTN